MRKLLSALAVATCCFFTSSVNAQEKYVVPHQQVMPDNNRPILGVQSIRTGNSLEVTGVAPYSAAARLGLEPGDRILEINGRQVRNQYELTSALSEAIYRHNGRVRVLIDNVRARYGEYGVQRFVSATTYLDGYGGGFDQGNGAIYSTP